MDFILGVRRIRGELDIAPSVPLAARLAGRLAAGSRALRAPRGRHPAPRRPRQSATALAAAEAPPQAAAALLGELRILVPLAGLIDVDAELARLGKRRGKVEQELARASSQARQRELRAECARRGGRRRSASGWKDSSVNWRNLPSSTSG